MVWARSEETDIYSIEKVEGRVLIGARRRMEDEKWKAEARFENFKSR